jgi:hypothetical protein
MVLPPAQTLLSVSDGRKMAEEYATAQDVPKWKNQALTRGFSRAGIAMTRPVPLADEGKDFRADEAFRVMEYRLGDKEAAGPQGSQLIRYTLVTNGVEVRKGRLDSR